MEPMNETLTDLLPVTTEDPEKSNIVNTVCVVAATAVATTLGWIAVGKIRDKVVDWRERRAQRTVVAAEPAPEEGE